MVSLLCVIEEGDDQFFFVFFFAGERLRDADVRMHGCTSACERVCHARANVQFPLPRGFHVTRGRYSPALCAHVRMPPHLRALYSSRGMGRLGMPYDT